MLKTNKKEREKKNLSEGKNSTRPQSLFTDASKFEYVPGTAAINTEQSQHPYQANTNREEIYIYKHKVCE